MNTQHARSAMPKTGKHLFRCQGASLTALFASSESTRADLFQDIARRSGYSEKWLDVVIKIAEERELVIGLVSHVHVAVGFRGKGIGKNLMEQYNQTIGQYTDVDLVFASIELPQAPDFSLQQFYADYDFEPVGLSSGDLMMATKNWASVFRGQMNVELATAPTARRAVASLVPAKKSSTGDGSLEFATTTAGVRCVALSR